MAIHRLSSSVMKPLACFLSLAMLPFFTACAKSEEKDAKPAAEKPATAAAKVEKVRLETSLGNIVIELNRDKAPVSVANFLSYVKKGHYDGTVFHRVIQGFMIQGGGFAKDGEKTAEKQTDKPITNEGKNGLHNSTGTIAMARTGDPNSATAQFFINVKDNQGLDFPNPDGHGYAVFGKVVEGMDVVKKIEAVQTAQGVLSMRHPRTGETMEMPSQDVPTTPVVITKAVVVE